MEKAHAFVFAQALFRIVRDYLLPAVGLVVPWSFIDIDVEPLLQDMLAGRYPYLKKSPALLLVAWIQRGAHYLSERRNSSTVSDAAESIRLGEQRIKLLEQYGIIK